MKKATAAAGQARFNEFLQDSRKGPVVVMHNGKPIAVLMGVHDEDELERLIFACSRRLQEILEAGRQEIRAGRAIPSDEFWKQVAAERTLEKKNKTRKKKSSSIATR